MYKLKTKKNRHGLYRLEYHLILVTKYRHKCITEELYQYLEAETRRLMCGWDVELVEMSYEPDHVHILISTTPQVNLGTLINSYKSVTSRLVRQKFKERLSQFYWKPYFWNRSYMILSSGGAPIEVIRRYIESQERDAAISH